MDLQGGFPNADNNFWAAWPDTGDEFSMNPYPAEEAAWPDIGDEFSMDPYPAEEDSVH